MSGHTDADDPAALTPTDLVPGWDAPRVEGDIDYCFDDSSCPVCRHYSLLGEWGPDYHGGELCTSQDGSP